MLSPFEAAMKHEGRVFQGSRTLITDAGTGSVGGFGLAIQAVGGSLVARAGVISARLGLVE